MIQVVHTSFRCALCPWTPPEREDEGVAAEQVNAHVAEHYKRGEVPIGAPPEPPRLTPERLELILADSADTRRFRDYILQQQIKLALKQAAADARILADLRAWLEQQRDRSSANYNLLLKSGDIINGAVLLATTGQITATLDYLDELERR